MTKTLEKQFYQELEKGNTKKALYIVKLMGHEVNKLYRGKSPLIWARKFENEEVINTLEEKGAKEEVISEVESKKLGKELVSKIIFKQFEEVDDLIDRGADVDVSNVDNTALCIAAQKGYLGVVESLIDAGADVNKEGISTHMFYTPLMFAAKNGHIEVVKKLIEHEAEVKGKSIYCSAIYYAFANNHFDIVDLLLENGETMDNLSQIKRVYDVEGAEYLEAKGVALDTAMLVESIGFVREDVALYYLEHSDNINLNYVDQKGATLLDMAINERRTRISAKLIEMGIDIEGQNGERYLLNASKMGDIGVVESVVEKGIDINVTNHHNETPLYRASLSGKAEIVDFLMKRGADYNIARDDGTTPLMCAVKYEETETIEALLSNMEKVPDKFIMAVNMSKDHSDERSLLMDFMNRVCEKNKDEKDKVMLDIIKDRY